MAKTYGQRQAAMSRMMRKAKPNNKPLTKEKILESLIATSVSTLHTAMIWKKNETNVNHKYADDEYYKYIELKGQAIKAYAELNDTDEDIAHGIVTETIKTQYIEYATYDQKQKALTAQLKAQREENQRKWDEEKNKGGN